MSIHKTIGILLILFGIVGLGTWFAFSSARTQAVPSGEMNDNRASLPNEISVPNTQINTMNTNETPATENQVITLQTSKGEITVELFL
ncbi:MAG: hypothetical protein WDZ74_02495, partial [Candidatus Paceibacterota bacterium]